MTIGERLEEARKRKGLAIRDVAEATKIRAEYLMSMESDSFDIPLPDVYVRGFLKNYCNHLKLDPTPLMTDFEALHLGGKHAQKDKGEVLGRMDLPENKGAGTQPSPSLPSKETEPLGTPFMEKSESRVHVKMPEDQTFYLKTFIVVAGTALIAILLWGIVTLLKSRSAPEINPELNAPIPAPPGATASAVEEDITLAASGPVTVIVEQQIDGIRLYEGTLVKNDRVPLKKKGPIIISFSRGDCLTVEMKDQRIPMSKTAEMGRKIIK